MTEPVPPTFSHRFDHPDRRKVIAVALACIAVLAAAAVTVGASPAPSGSAGASGAPAASTAPDASALPEHGHWRLDGDVEGPRGFGGIGGIGLARFGGVEITAISGSELSLQTVDGWTRTISVEPDTIITKGDATIGVDDLAVGDSIRFRQVRDEDGTFTIVRIDVVQPHVAGTVTDVSGSTITVELPGGTTTTIHVDEGTAFKVEGVDGTATVEDVEVGMRIVASGEQNDDGSLDAARVLAGTGRLRDIRPWKGAPGAPGGPDASPAPDASGNPG
jgi:Domain of unknown function (DUF5666)